MSQKRYLVYYGKSAENGISGYDYQDALQKARNRTPDGIKSKIRIRLASTPLLRALANQGEYPGSRGWK
jgi:hypothetical protein